MTGVGEWRRLTAGERAIAQAAFGAALDPNRVRLWRQRWFAPQPRQTVMAPDGDIWFHPRGTLWREDFTHAPRHAQGLLVHELTHCWQVQTRGSLVWRRLPWARYGYTPGRPFARYGIEQQAEIVAHRWLAGRAPALPA